jgi:hypothetical protein
MDYGQGRTGSGRKGRICSIGSEVKGVIVRKRLVILMMATVLMTGCSSKHERVGFVIATPQTSKVTATTLQNVTTGKDIPQDIKNTPSYTPFKSGDIVAATLPKNSGDGKLVKKSKKARYINSYELKHDMKQLEITRDDIKITMNFSQISGLADKQLEKKMNETILKDVKKAISEEIDKPVPVGEENASGLYCFPVLSANNLLSMKILNMYDKPIHGLLYRVSDGKRLKIKDLFTKGTDYITLLNKQIELGILGGEIDETELLYMAFSGIKEDQDFLLTDSEIHIIFHKGDGGVAKEHSVRIPLYRIDDYVNIFDMDYRPEVYELPDNVQHRNNIFLLDKSEIRTLKNGKLWIKYNEISGIGDAKFEKIINTKIRSQIEEYVKLDIWAGLTEKQNTGDNKYIWMSGRIGEIEIIPELNQDGILSIRSHIRLKDYSRNVDKYTKCFTFDLLNKTPTSFASMLENKFRKNKTVENAFMNRVRDDLDSKCGYVIKLLMGEKSPDFNFSFLKKNSMITLGTYPDDGSAELSIFLTAGSINGLKEPISTSINIKDFFHMTPYTFLHN